MSESVLSQRIVHPCFPIIDTLQKEPLRVASVPELRALLDWWHWQEPRWRASSEARQHCRSTPSANRQSAAAVLRCASGAWRTFLAQQVVGWQSPLRGGVQQVPGWQPSLPGGLCCLRAYLLLLRHTLVRVLPDPLRLEIPHRELTYHPWLEAVESPVQVLTWAFALVEPGNSQYFPWDIELHAGRVDLLPEGWQVADPVPGVWAILHEHCRRVPREPDPCTTPLEMRQALDLALECCDTQQEADCCRQSVQDLDRPTPPVPEEQGLPDSAVLSVADLVEVLRLSKADGDALRKRLERYRREEDLAGTGWQENEDARGRQARYLYRVGAIRHILADFMSDKASDKK